VFREVDYKPQGDSDSPEGTRKVVNNRPLNMKVSTAKIGKVRIARGEISSGQSGPMAHEKQSSMPESLTE